MKIRKLIAPALLAASAALMFSAAAYAGGKHEGKPHPHHPHPHKPEVFKGCYDVVQGNLIESPAEDQETIGTYSLVLVPQDARGRGKPKSVELSGPSAGREEPGGHEEGEEGEEGEEHEGEEETHGKHWFGTFNHSGVFIATELSAVVTGVGCIDPVTGFVGLIHGSETLEFVKGTGAYSGLIGGEVIFTGTVDRCTDPNNIVTTFDEITGEMCFQE